MMTSSLPQALQSFDFCSAAQSFARSGAFPDAHMLGMKFLYEEELVMFRRQQPQHATDDHPPRAFDDFHEWILSLPWVVERPPSLAAPGVRTFGVDCEPLGRRQLWLLTGLQQQLESDGFGMAVIVPSDVAAEVEAVGWGRCVAPMPARHAMVAVYGDTLGQRAELEAFVLTAYGYAMS